MADRQKIKSVFDQLKHDPNHHLGLGDIRLTVGQQDEIINLFPETTTPQNTISSDRQKAEEILYKWEVESSDRIMDMNEHYERIVFPSIFEFAEWFHAQQVEAVTDEEIKKRNKQTS